MCVVLVIDDDIAVSGIDRDFLRSDDTLETSLEQRVVDAHQGV